MTTAETVLPGFDPAFVKGRLDYDIEAWTKTRKNLSELAEYLAGRLTDPSLSFPKGAELKIDEYDLRFFTINVRIPLEPERSWRGLQGTAGVVYRVRKFLGIPKLHRYPQSEAATDVATTFFGALNIGFREDVPTEPQSWSVRIRCEGAVPETCHLEEVVTLETIERKRYKVVCK